jgi:hypothetical protein
MYANRRRRGLAHVLSGGRSALPCFVAHARSGDETVATSHLPVKIGVEAEIGGILFVVHLILLGSTFPSGHFWCALVGLEAVVPQKTVCQQVRQFILLFISQ